jgi:hypothetical protein
MRTLVPGQVVEGHLLVEKIGEGGFGQVWRAEYLGDTVALKIFESEGLRHVRHEAVAQYRLGRLRSDDARHFPRVEHISLETEIAYMRMEFIDGCCLDDHLESRPELATPDRISLARSILVALAAVHRNGFVHGDLSPCNVIVSPDGSIRLIDVGVGAAFSHQDVRPSGGPERPLGVASPMYAAPERFTRAFHECGKQADVYSFGKLFYFLMTGEDPVAIKPLSKARPDLQGDWDEFLFTCVESRPEKRPADAARALETFEELNREPESGFVARCVRCEANTLVPEAWLGKEFSCRGCNKRMEVLFLDVDAGEAQVRACDTDIHFVAGAPAAVEEPPRARRRPAPHGPRSVSPAAPDYSGKALVAFALFFFFWLPGAIATALFLAQAREDARRTGLRPQGIELLEAFMWMFVYIPMGILGFIILIAALG